MTRISQTDLGDTPNQRILGHNPDVLKAFQGIMEAVFRKTSLDPELKEQVRRTLAWGWGCRH